MSQDTNEDQQEYEAAKEEAWYYSTLHDFIIVMQQYGYEKVKKDLGEMLAHHWRL